MNGADFDKMEIFYVGSLKDALNHLSLLHTHADPAK